MSKTQKQDWPKTISTEPLAWDEDGEVLSYKHVFMRENGSVGVETVNSEPTMTQVQFQAECDVNNIMAQYIHNPDPHIFERNGRGQYGDFTSAEDFHQTMEKVTKARESFDSLDAQLRFRFGNDPGQLLSFLNNPQNKEEAIKLGLVNAPPTPTPELNPQPNPNPK
jgi:phage internal scaffolding protein